MSGPLFILRPEPGLAATAQAAAAMGLDVRAEALARVCPVAWAPPPLTSIDALLLGSANAVRQGADALAELRGLPALVVGTATAAAAEEAGLEVVAIGTGGLQVLLDEVGSRFPRLLRLAGEKHVSLTPSPGVTIETRIVYRVKYLPIPRALASELANGGVVLLHSAEMARHLASECERLGVPRAGLAVAALAPRIAEAADGGWKEVAVASAPSDDALLALASDMCQ